MNGIFDVARDPEPVAPLLRGLKGGSGGGGGGRGGGGRGSSSSRGGSYCHECSTSGNGYGGGRRNFPVWAIALIVLVPFLGICACCYFRKKHKQAADGDGAIPGGGSSFDEAVSEMRGEHMANVADAAPGFESYTGDFDIKYNDRGTELSGGAKILIKDNGRGAYKIEGDCNDADGIAKITEGFASYSGDAWWVEETFSGKDIGLKVLTKGRFDFSNNTFAGTWRANNGVRGSYTSFQGKNVSKTFSPGVAMASDPQTLQEMLEEDIPTVNATVETPSHTASPLVVHAIPEAPFAVPAVSAFPDPSAPSTDPASSYGDSPGLYVPRA